MRSPTVRAAAPRTPLPHSSNRAPARAAGAPDIQQQEAMHPQRRERRRSRFWYVIQQQGGQDTCACACCCCLLCTSRYGYRSLRGVHGRLLRRRRGGAAALQALLPHPLHRGLARGTYYESFSRKSLLFQPIPPPPSNPTKHMCSPYFMYSLVLCCCCFDSCRTTTSAPAASPR
jgi:hypothetical protein